MSTREEFEEKAETIICEHCKISVAFYILQDTNGSVVVFCNNCESILPILVHQQRRIMK